MATYLSDIPKASDSPSTSQGQLLNNFGYLAASMGKDHNFTLNSANATDGFHKQVTFASNQAAPGFGGGVSDLFSNTTAGVASLQWQNASGSFAITGLNPSIGAQGYTCLPGGILIQWGFKNNCAAAATIAWPIAFTACYSATFTPVKSGTSYPAVQIVSLNAANASISMDISGTRTVYFLAIGTKV